MRKAILLALLLLSVVVTYGFNSHQLSTNSSYAQLKKVVSIAESYDTIVIQGKIIIEDTIVIKKPLYITGNKGVLDGGDKTSILYVFSDSVTITNLSFVNVGRDYVEDKAAVTVFKSKHVNVTNCTFRKVFFGIMYLKSELGIIANNDIQGNAVDEYSSANAIHLWHCNNMDILDNKVRNHRDGIYLEFVSESVIQGNVSADNLRYGLHFMFSDKDKYIDNTFKNNGAGVAVMFSNFIEMTSNKFEHNWGSASYGLLLKEIYDSNISKNIFYQNSIGIYAEGVNRTNIKYNNFVENGWAFKISGSSLDNQLTLNNFIGNTFNMSTNSSHNDNFLFKNYWDDYAGYDLNKDGTGDLPYYPVNIYTYLVSRIDESLVLLRSSFVEMLNLAEKVAPSLTPISLVDATPLMKPVKW